MALPEKPFCVIDRDIAGAWWIKPIISLVDHCLVDQAHPFGLRRVIMAAQSGQMVVVFPESRISLTGSLMKCYGGAAFVAEKAGAPILPIHIDGAQLSKFSYLGGIIKRRFFPKITASIQSPRPVLSSVVRNSRALFLFDILTDARLEVDRNQSLISLIHRAADQVGHDKPALANTDGVPLSYGKLLEKISKRHATRDQSIVELLVTIADARKELSQAEERSPRVEINEAEVIRAANGLGAAWDICPGDIVLNTTSLNNGFGVIAGLILPLIQGATIFQFKKQQNKRSLPETIYDANTTVLIIDDNAFSKLKPAHSYDFHKLRMIVSSSPKPTAGLPPVPYYRAIGGDLNGLPIAAQSPLWNDPDLRFRQLRSIDPVSAIRFDDDGFSVDVFQE